MAVFEVDLHAFWMAHPQLGAHATPIKLWPGRLPPNPTFPAATYQRTSSSEEETHSGVTDFQEPRIQFSVYDNDWLECWQAAARVRGVFKSFRGVMGSTEVNRTRKDNDFDSRDPETGLPRRIIDVFIRYRET